MAPGSASARRGSRAATRSSAGSSSRPSSRRPRYAPDVRWAPFDILVAAGDDDDGELLAFSDADEVVLDVMIDLEAAFPDAWRTLDDAAQARLAAIVRARHDIAVE